MIDVNSYSTIEKYYFLAWNVIGALQKFEYFKKYYTYSFGGDLYFYECKKDKCFYSISIIYNSLAKESKRLETIAITKGSSPLITNNSLIFYLQFERVLVGRNSYLPSYYFKEEFYRKLLDYDDEFRLTYLTYYDIFNSNETI